MAATGNNDLRTASAEDANPEGIEDQNDEDWKNLTMPPVVSLAKYSG